MIDTPAEDRHAVDPHAGDRHAEQRHAVDRHAEDRLKERIAAELTAVRRRSGGLTTEVLDEQELVRQHSPLMSPLVWDLAHVGNYEELWLLREAAGIEPMRPEIDDLYDAFEHPRAERVTLPLLTPGEATGYIDQVRRKVLDSLERVRFTPDTPLLAGGFVYGMVVQHEHMHDETMLATHQLRKGDPVLRAAEPPEATAVPPAETLIPEGPFTMGTSDDPWAYDNERPGHTRHLDAYLIDTTPVTNAQFQDFMEAGGYETPEYWTRAGREWLERTGKRHPANWVRDGDGWAVRVFGRPQPLRPDRPVQHVCWYEADAYARWAGKRLPTEAEWEKAAAWDPVTRHARRYPWGDEEPDPAQANLGQHHLGPAAAGAYPSGASAYGVQQLLGDVWEWTATSFDGYPGFRSFPYREYSEVFFGDGYKVLRGGSWATHPLACRNTFRNWDLPIRRQIFAGFRCARDAHETSRA
ncbi:MAG: ergothioneine biosynthesis protein EgtB [Streptosporangiales bacterium]|nr:ergothioneine biosynthesis protein EgtB [Streptosporangiales bacterium]